MTIPPEQQPDEDYAGPPGWLIIGGLALMVTIPAIFALVTLLNEPDSAFRESMERNSELGGGPYWLIGTFLVLVPVVGLWVAYVWKRSRDEDGE